MDITFSQTPQLFGLFHLLFVAGILLACIPVFLVIRTFIEKQLIRLLAVLGWIMIIMEIWKQWFSYRYVYGFSMWFFPWQLCSMAMYCCVSLPLLKEKSQNTVLLFLATYSLVAAVMALAVPADMLRPQILLTCHGFIYHGLMLWETMAALLILNKRRQFRFAEATVLFMIMAAIAEAINIASHYILNNIRIEPDMFNITPYYPTNQPVFAWIAETLGIIPEIIIYLLCIILAGWGICLLEKRIINRK